METYHPVDPYFVDKFLSSIYVDDLVSGSVDVNSAFEFYKKSRQRLAVAGFRLQKFITNSEELRRLIYLNESQSEGGGAEDVAHVEEDLSYAKCTLGVEDGQQQGVHKILGIQWNVINDDFQFDIGAMEGSDPTKKSVVSATAKFFDQLGIVSPITVLFKMFAQQLSRLG